MTSCDCRCDLWRAKYLFDLTKTLRKVVSIRSSENLMPLCDDVPTRDAFALGSS